MYEVRYFYHIDPSGECSVIGRGIVIDPCSMIVQRSIAGDLWRDAGVATLRQTVAQFREINAELVHEEGKQ